MPDPIENVSGIFSLADLASMDTSSVKELTSLIPAAGIYQARGTEIKAGQLPEQEGKPTTFAYTFVSEVMAAKLVDKNVDPETVVGRRLSDAFTLWPTQFADLVGLLKGRYKTIGIPNDGPRIGGVEGQEPGWLDNWVGAEYSVKVTHFTDKGGNVRARFTYMKPQVQSAA